VIAVIVVLGIIEVTVIDAGSRFAETKLEAESTQTIIRIRGMKRFIGGNHLSRLFNVVDLLSASFRLARERTMHRSRSFASMMEESAEDTLALLGARTDTAADIGNSIAGGTVDTVLPLVGVPVLSVDCMEAYTY